MAIYMKYGDIQGNVTHPTHADWIDCTSFQFGTGRSIHTPIGRTANRECSQPSVSDITITKEMDASTPYLFKASCTGDVGEDCEIDIVETGADELRQIIHYELENCLISGYQVSTGGERPTESLSLSFTKLEMTYVPTDELNEEGDPITAGFDLMEAKPF